MTRRSQLKLIVLTITPRAKDIEFLSKENTIFTFEKMNYDNQLLKKALHDLADSYEYGLAFLINLKTKCDESMNVDFIAKNLEAIRSNQK